MNGQNPNLDKNSWVHSEFGSIRDFVHNMSCCPIWGFAFGYFVPKWIRVYFIYDLNIENMFLYLKTEHIGQQQTALQAVKTEHLSIPRFRCYDVI